MNIIFLFRKKEMSKRTRNNNYSCWIKNNLFYRKHEMPTTVAIETNMSKSFNWKNNKSSPLYYIRYFSHDNIMISHSDFLITSGVYIKF